MRLVCPNCGAHYAVDDSVIPEAGRDVQCSNCGHSWFQLPDGARERVSAAARMAGQAGPKRETTKIATGTPDEPETPAADPVPERPARRALDSAVMDVLREEAEREKAARAAEAPPEPVHEPAPEPVAEAPPAAETTRIAEPLPEPAPQPEAQPEPAPEHAPEPDERRVASETHKARMRGENPAVAVAALSGRAAHRSEMLPDIEEINSTLRASADPSRTAEEAGAASAEIEKQKAKRGFRLGFGFVAILAVLAFLAYTQAPRIAAAVPALEAPLASYVSAVNAGRLWLDTTLRGAGSE
ncbi:zinc-ribbon domain-containing protein [Oceanicola sp. 502str15]|uniref:zinc-ribbon domain-containing protein n=1 Tax=Oceanicola sp. 502str15 TaxID=2696061 RepID=UPI0020944FF6|nr:zinc-ribbon domain-containing protein [Oceanicola sp. 502str15]MCO6385049.1 hypothetical protein [Oceanicola sp. 502str15]